MVWGILITDDFPERELLYEELRKSEERYRFAAELTGQLIYDWDFSTGQIVWAGPITEFTGYSADGYQKCDMRRWLAQKEIYHRVKNNLQVISSLLDLQADRFSDRQVKAAFRECQNRVLSMALIYEELYRSGLDDKINFAAYLLNLTNEIFKSYNVGKTNVGLKIDLKDIFLGMNTAVPLGIIVNELVSNALKYGFPFGREGVIHVTLQRKENAALEVAQSEAYTDCQDEKNLNCMLIVEDDGQGIPEETDFHNTDSLGFQLVNSLVEQIDGCVELKRDKGTKFTIRFSDIDA